MYPTFDSNPEPPTQTWTKELLVSHGVDIVCLAGTRAGMERDWTKRPTDLLVLTPDRKSLSPLGYLRAIDSGALPSKEVIADVLLPGGSEAQVYNVLRRATRDALRAFEPAGRSL